MLEEARCVSGKESATFQDDLQLVGEDFERRYRRSVLRDDVLSVPGPAGELEEVVAWVRGSVHGAEEIRRGLHALGRQADGVAV